MIHIGTLTHVTSRARVHHVPNMSSRLVQLHCRHMFVTVEYVLRVLKKVGNFQKYVLFIMCVGA
jgi:hypothetical protein